MVFTLMIVCRLVFVKDEIIIFIASRKEKCSRQGVGATARRCGRKHGLDSPEHPVANSECHRLKLFGPHALCQWKKSYEHYLVRRFTRGGMHPKVLRLAAGCHHHGNCFTAVGASTGGRMSSPQR